MVTRKKYYQGEDIIFDLSLTNDDGATYLDLVNDFTDIVLYFYINAKEHIIKVSKLARDGYIQFTQPDLSDNTKLRAVIDSSITKCMPCGTVMVEINVLVTSTEVTDGELNRIGKQEAFYIEQAVIRRESNYESNTGLY